jgi:hypothetical protein
MAPTQPAPTAPQQPAERQTPAPTEPQQRSILDRLLGRQRPSGSPPPSPSRREEDKQRSQRAYEQRRQQVLAIMIPALREIGARRVYCRYDGGNDEGFAWLDSVELQAGERINADALGRRLYEIQVQDKLYVAGIANRAGGVLDQEGLQDLVRDWLVDEWAPMLLGNGYGTGEYSMYGAFTVDLDACVITDDPDAEAVVENIEIAGQDE